MFRTSLRTKLTSLPTKNLPRFTSIRTRTASSSGPDAQVGPVHMDQTREGNDPTAEKTDTHKQNAKSADSRKEELTEQQQGNPQPTPERATGIESNRSDGGKAGEGAVRNVHRETDAGPHMPGFENQTK